MIHRLLQRPTAVCTAWSHLAEYLVHAVFWFANLPTSVAVTPSHPADRSHADTTWEDIVRDDYSTFHVADYDPETGELVETGAMCSAVHNVRRSLSSVTDVVRCSNAAAAVGDAAHLVLILTGLYAGFVG